MDEYIVLDLKNLEEVAERTKVPLDTLRHLYGAALTRKNQYILFRLGSDNPKWTGIEMRLGISAEWVIRHISRLED
jgi:hypothetical protein